MQLDEQWIALALDTDALYAAFHAAKDRLGGEDSARAVTGWTGFGHALEMTLAHALARSLDDVMDAIDASASLVRMYRLDRVLFGARELAHIISSCTTEVRLALAALEQTKGVAAHSVEINRLENEADRTHQQAVMRLFDDERDPISVMKWKETLDFLEDATDRCEDVANVIEGVMVKHG